MNWIFTCFFFAFYLQVEKTRLEQILAIARKQTTSKQMPKAAKSFFATFIDSVNKRLNGQE